MKLGQGKLDDTSDTTRFTEILQEYKSIFLSVKQSNDMSN